jgi:DNA-binding transcriptional LysR family regulator
MDFGTTRLSDMAIFAAVVEEASFTAAGARFGLPKQAVSRRIAGLEAALGARLLHRSTRRVAPTEVGAAFAARCVEVLRLAEEAWRESTAPEATPRGVLRITCDAVVAEHFAGPLVIEYVRRFPQVAVELHAAARRVDLVAERFDVAIRVGAVSDPGLVARRLGPARIALVAAPDYLARRGEPSVPSDLGDHDLVVVAEDDAPVRWPVGRPERARLRLPSAALALSAVRAGLGIGLFPGFLCADDLAGGRVVPVLPSAAAEVGGIWLVRPADPRVSAKVRAFVDLVVARLEAAPWA